MKNYFTIKELIKSDTAEKYKIDNTPDSFSLVHLKVLIAFLNPLREAWGSAIRVSSGYRCKEVNKLVGGSITSAHMYGWAADLIPMNNKMTEFKSFIIDYLKDKNFDQCIIEKQGIKEWIHLGLYNSTNRQRRQCFKINK